MVYVAVLAGSMVVSTIVGATPAAAEVGDPIGDDAQELAERYSPIIMLKAQDGPCDEDGEPYGPMSVEPLLDNPEILLRQVSPQLPVVVRGPSARDLFDLGEGFFLDFPGVALTPECIYETDYRKYTEDEPAVVYAHIVQQPDRPDRLALQYWFYWYYNDWNNKHESDWEGIQLLFEATSIEEALSADPLSIGYAQHEGGERADWEDQKLRKRGSRPVVFSSAGSHASYFASALYLGRSGGEGFGCDNTDGPSVAVDPEVVLLPDSVEDPEDQLAWLAFAGRWGERQSGPFNGPTGPAAKERWLEPIDWHDDLRSRSVVIPGGDTQASEIFALFCSTVEWGSGQMIAFSTSPVRALATATLFTLLVVWLIRRTDWSRVPTHPLVMARRAGQILRAAMTSYASSARALLFFGLIYIPAMAAAGVLAAVLGAVPVVGRLLDLTSTASGTGLGLGLLVGGVTGLVAYVALNAMVSSFWVVPEDERSARSVLGEVGSRGRDLAAALARAFVIVAVLLISIVGIPWGIRQLVRYQMAPQVIMLEGLNGRDALRRSSELVRGRWWHTAVVLGAFNAVVALVALGLGLLILVLIPQIPLWLFTAIIPVVNAVIVPIAAVAQTLLYGDMIASREDATAVERTVVVSG
jgi:hypothetical protein